MKKRTRQSSGEEAYYQMPKALLRMKLDWNVRGIYMLIYERIRLSAKKGMLYGGEPYCYFAEMELADVSGLGVRTVRRGIAALKKEGLLTTQKSIRGANMYFLPDALSEQDSEKNSPAAAADGPWERPELHQQEAGNGLTERPECDAVYAQSGLTDRPQMAAAGATDGRIPDSEATDGRIPDNEAADGRCYGPWMAVSCGHGWPISKNDISKNIYNSAAPENASAQLEEVQRRNAWKRINADHRS